MRAVRGSSSGGGWITVRRCVESLVREGETDLDGSGVRDSMHQPSTAGRLKVQFFHPVLWSKLGALLVDGYEGATEERGEPVNECAVRQGRCDRLNDSGELSVMCRLKDPLPSNFDVTVGDGAPLLNESSRSSCEVLLNDSSSSIVSQLSLDGDMFVFVQRTSRT